MAVRPRKRSHLPVKKLRPLSPRPLMAGLQGREQVPVMPLERAALRALRQVPEVLQERAVPQELRQVPEALRERVALQGPVVKPAPAVNPTPPI